MKKFIALFLVSIMMLGLLAGCGSSESKETTAENKAEDVTTGNATEEVTDGDSNLELVESGKLIMSTNAQFPPYEMTTDNGGFEGIDVEIAGAIAEKLGLELVIDDMDFDSALLAVQQGKSDIVMAGVSVTDERRMVMEFSESYATGIQVVIVKEGSDVTMDNLGDKMIGCQRGTTGYIYASDDPEYGGYGEDHVTAFDNGASAVQALMNGQVDCVIIDSAPAAEYVKANPGLTTLEANWVEEDYAIGLNKGSVELKKAVNNALKELIEDGTVQNIIDKYITAE